MGFFDKAAVNRRHTPSSEMAKTMQPLTASQNLAHDEAVWELALNLASPSATVNPVSKMHEEAVVVVLVVEVVLVVFQDRLQILLH